MNTQRNRIGTRRLELLAGVCLFGLVTASCNGPQLESYHVSSGAQSLGLASATPSLTPASLRSARAPALERMSMTDPSVQKRSASESRPAGSPSDGLETFSVTEDLEREGFQCLNANLDLRPGLMNASFEMPRGNATGLSAFALGATPASGNTQAAPAAGSADPDHCPHCGGELHQGHGSLDEIAAKLANPVSDVWAMFTQFGLAFSDGDVNEGDAQVSGSVLFQPILPIPVTENLKLITRPTIPFLFGQPVPKGQNDFNHLSGFGDSSLPLLLSPKAGNWLLGAGPGFSFPTSTQDKLGRRQWATGVSGIIGYKTKDAVFGVFPQYYWGIGSRGDQGDTPDASFMNLLYFAFYNLPDAWQVGFNPNITYDDKVKNSNKWNVPIGMTVAKTIHIGKVPTKIQVGFEYSVVRQDDFGQEFLLKVNLIPVIPALIKSPIFGGG